MRAREPLSSEGVAQLGDNSLSTVLSLGRAAPRAVRSSQVGPCLALSDSTQVRQQVVRPRADMRMQPFEHNARGTEGASGTSMESSDSRAVSVTRVTFARAFLLMSGKQNIGTRISTWYF
mmetsp:Transcript_104157/g.264490  ORF Transcript_104157/g.264490 Transcript_104157/m.264490 type:complete len:120 (+) Transcript_104157:282-641(+)